jgi:hypothetical protein
VDRVTGGLVDGVIMHSGGINSVQHDPMIRAVVHDVIDKFTAEQTMGLDSDPVVVDMVA